MSELPIKIINNPHEFVDAIFNNITSELCAYVEDIFTPLSGIKDNIIRIHNTFQPICIFMDINIVYNNKLRVPHYFNDVIDRNSQTIICSPLIVKNFPTKLTVHPNLRYHSASFLFQIQKQILPWHIPRCGFELTFDHEIFSALDKDSQWILANVK